MHLDLLVMNSEGGTMALFNCFFQLPHRRRQTDDVEDRKLNYSSVLFGGPNETCNTIKSLRVMIVECYYPKNIQ